MIEKLKYKFLNRTNSKSQLDNMKKTASKVVLSQTIRGCDIHGCGTYGASRPHGRHNGLDIATKSGDTVYSPISGKIIREKLPYNDDLSFRGLVIAGKGKWQGYEITIFYVRGSRIHENVKEGDDIGTAQDLTKRYPGITNHIHVEVKKNGFYINPSEIW